MSKCLQALSLLAVLGFLSVAASADMIVYLPFDDGTNPTLTNYGTLGGAATVAVGVPAATANSKIGPYAEDLSAGQVLAIGSGVAGAIPNMDTSGQTMSIVAYVDLPSTGGTLGLCSKTDTSGTGWSFMIDGSQLTGRFTGGEAGWVWSNEVGSVPTNTWTQVAMTWTTDGALDYYINGALVGSQTMGTVGAPNSGWPMLIGTMGNGDGRTLNGLVDDFRLYNTILTQAQIKALMPVHVGPYNWIGSGTNNWSDASSWDAGAVPAVTDSAAFSASAGGTVNVDQASMTIANATVTGSGNWTFGPVVLGHWQNPPPPTNVLTVTNGFTYSGTGWANIYCVLGGGPVTVNSGILRLGNPNNTFTGGVFVNGGAVTTNLIGNATAASYFGSNTIYLGSTTAGNTSATLEPQVGDEVAPFNSPIVVRSGNSGQAIISYIPVDNVAVASPSYTIWPGWPAITFSSSISLQKDVTLSDNAVIRDPYDMGMTVSGTISGTGGVITQGQSYMTVSGNNSYTGTTCITGASQTFFTGSSTFTGPINVQGGALFAESNASLGNASNVITLGTANSIGGVGPNDQNASFNRTINLVGNGFLTSNGGTGTFTGVIGGSGALIIGVNGSAGWEDWTGFQFQSNNTYTGGTTVVAGIVGDPTGGAYGSQPYDAYYNLNTYGSGNVAIKFGGSLRLTASTNMGAGAKVLVNDVGVGGGLILGGDFMPNIDPSSSGTLIWDINRGAGGAGGPAAVALGNASQPIGNGYMFLSAFNYNPIPDSWTGGSIPNSAAALVMNQKPAADGSKTYFLEGNLCIGDDGGGCILNDYTDPNTGLNQSMNVQIGKPGVWGEFDGGAVTLRSDSNFSGMVTIEPNYQLYVSLTNRAFGSTTGSIYLNGSTYDDYSLNLADGFAKTALSDQTITKGAVYFNGSTYIALNDGGTGILFATASYNRQNRGTIGLRSMNNVLGASQGPSEMATVTAAPIVTNNMVAPYFWDGQGNNFVTYGATGFADVTATVPSLAGATSSQIVYSSGEAVSGSESAYAIRTTGALTGSGTVTVGDGVNPAGVIFTAAATHTANFAFGGSEGIIYTPDTSANTLITGTISGTNGITKSGAGNLEVTGTNSGLSGNITVNQGMFVYGFDSETGSGNLVLNGGTIAFGHVSQAGQQITTNKTIEIGPNGGTLAVSAWYNGNISRPHFAGNIVDLDPTHPGPLALGGNWGIYIEGTANTYSGGTFINGMSGVTVAATSCLGTGDVIVAGNGGAYSGNPSQLFLLGDHNISTTARLYLQSDSSMACFESANPTVGSIEGLGYVTLGQGTQYYGGTSTTLTTGLNNLNTDFYGRIQDYNSFDGTTDALTKAGTGTFTLWGANTYTGATTVNNGTLVNNDLISGAVTVTPGSAGQTPVYGGTGTTLGLVTVSGGTVTGAGLLSNGLVLNSGAVTGSTTVNGSVTVNGGDFGGSGTINGNLAAIAGTVDGSAAVNGNVTIAGSTVTGTHAISGNVAISSGSFTAGAGSTLGSLNVTGTGAYAGSSAIAGAVELDAGTIAGTHTIGGNYTQNGGAFSGTSAIGTAGSPVAVTINAGSFSGNHTIYGSFTTAAGSNAALAPHNGASAGTLTINGAVTLDHSTTLNFNLGPAGTTGSNDNDFINIAGPLSLDGTLNVNALGGFGVGTYTLIDYTGALSGAGLSLGTTPGLGFNYAIDTTTANEINLDVTGMYPAGDTNHDGLVNSLDIDWIYQNLTVAPTSYIGTWPRPLMPYNKWCDVNGDGVVNQLDVTYELNHYFHTSYGDANLDRATDFGDFQTLLNHWQASGAAIGWAQADYNGDGVVDFLDFQILLNYWNPGGWNYAPSQTPEPASLTLILLGALGLVRRRRSCC
jgi:MYXO-CTERM domain-containing protein